MLSVIGCAVWPRRFAWSFGYRSSTTFFSDCPTSLRVPPEASMTSKFLQFWTGVVILLTVISCWLHLTVPLSEIEIRTPGARPWPAPHKWLAFSCSLRKESSRLGAVCRSVPSAAGHQFSDTYVHWPPLFAILMGMASPCFGESVSLRTVLPYSSVVLYFSLRPLAKHNLWQGCRRPLAVWLARIAGVRFAWSFPWTKCGCNCDHALALYCFLRATVSVLSTGDGSGQALPQ